MIGLPGATRSGADTLAAIEPGSREEARLGRLARLDGVRAIAVWLVLSAHLVRILDMENRAWAIPFRNGGLGVDLFFTLSGFLITRQMLKRWGGVPRGPDLLEYLRRRFWRIVPTYYVVLVLSAMGLIAGRKEDVPVTPGRLVAHLLFMQDYIPSTALRVGWSLGVEEKFYLLAPLLLAALLALPTLRSRLVLLAALASVPIMVRATADLGGDTFYLLRTPFHMNLTPLAIGVAAAMGLRTIRAIVWGPWFGVLGLILALVTLDINDRWFYSLGALGMGSFMVGVLYGPSGALPWLEGRFARLTATLAYSLYLTHLAAAPLALHLPSGLQALGFILLAYLIAIVLHITVERPCLARMRRTPERTNQLPHRRRHGGRDEV